MEICLSSVSSELMWNSRNSKKMSVYQALTALENLRTHETLEVGGTVKTTPTPGELLELIKFREFLESFKIQQFLGLSSCCDLCSFKISKSSLTS